MENLIFGAFATLDGYREGDAANLGRTVYDRCTVVALCSAKAQNPACTVALLTNAPVPEPFRSQLTQGGVEIWDCPFTTYRVPADTNWALAYYKLCAMAWVLENRDFARAVMLDLDTFTQRPLDDLWRECDEAVLLYQVPHAASQTMTAAISRCFDAVEPDGAPHALTHFGGELVAGSKARLTDFMSLCRDYFKELQAKGITPKEGDEAVWCGAAYRSLLAGKPVRAANAYIFRYWLGGHFYYVSTNYTLDPVCILHLPGAAKDRQLKLIYNDYARRGVFPPLKKIYRLCGLPAAHPPLLRTVWTRLLAKLEGAAMSRRKNDLSQRLEAVIKTLVPQQEQNPDDLGPMMRAIKAVHSISDHTSTTPEDLERQRAAEELFARLVTPGIGIRSDSLTVGSIPAEWVSLEHGHDRRHAVLYCHGGGYTCGQLGYARILASKLALATGFDVLSFEYRLAPEHPFPAAIEDAVAMWDYLMYMGYGARDVIVAGDSAGGNLALELALKLKEQGRAQPRGLVLFSPWTDMTASGKSYRTCKTLDPMLTMEYIAAVREAYTGPDADWSRPCYSPLFADLRGLPPTLVQVGTNEILKSDSERLVENLQKAGVYAQLEVYPECWHVFQQMPIRRAAVAMESAGRFVQRII